MHRLTLLLSAVLLGACVGDVYRDPEVTIASKADFDARRYAGLWYEIARFPVPFEAGCEGVTAEYGLRPDGVLTVKNTCRDGAVDGPLREIEGTARVTGPGRLSVRFSSVPFVAAPYWVLWVDADYTVAVVGVPSGRAGWILSRTPTVSEDRLKAAMEVLDFNGYDVTKLRPVRQPPA